MGLALGCISLFWSNSSLGSSENAFYQHPLMTIIQTHDHDRDTNLRLGFEEKLRTDLPSFISWTSVKSSGKAGKLEQSVFLSYKPRSCKSPAGLSLQKPAYFAALLPLLNWSWQLFCITVWGRIIDWSLFLLEVWAWSLFICKVTVLPLECVNVAFRGKGESRSFYSFFICRDISSWIPAGGDSWNVKGAVKCIIYFLD